MKKEIKVKSNIESYKNYIKKNIIYRIFLLILRPINLFEKLKNYRENKLKIEKINWSLRAQKHGKYSVLSTDTPKSEFDYVTNLQKEIMFSNLKKFLNNKEKKILDFGCGNGRFSEHLGKINNNVKVIAVDKEKKLIDIAKRGNNVSYIWLRDLSQIRMRFDLIFIVNVLGGFEKKELPKLIRFLITKLNRGGMIFLSEHISEQKIQGPEILKGWSFRDDDYYINLFRKVFLRKVDEYKYNNYRTSIYVGRK